MQQIIKWYTKKLPFGLLFNILVYEIGTDAQFCMASLTLGHQYRYSVGLSGVFCVTFSKNVDCLVEPGATFSASE